MSKSLAQLKKEGSPPEMRVVKPHGQLYEPRHEKYFDWYYSDEQKKKREDEDV